MILCNEPSNDWISESVLHLMMLFFIQSLDNKMNNKPSNVLMDII